MFHLVVRNPFAGYQTGNRITDKAEIEKILASGNAANVVKISGGADATPKKEAPAQKGKAPKPATTTTEESSQ